MFTDSTKEAPEIPGVDEYLKAVFGKTGYLAREFDGYRVRHGQVEIARSVDAALRGIDDSQHAIAEGPTGTGKSLAYLVPATYHAKRTGKPIIVATANIALQEQLVKKDLPLLAKVLPWNFSFALLKGIGNYLCLDSAEKNDSAKQMGLKFAGFDRTEEKNIRQAEQIIEWSRLTRTGDKSELPFEPHSRVWSAFSTTSDDCKRDKCEFAEDCFAMHAIEEAKNADVIVTNFHMLFAHIAVARKTNYNVQILPAADTVICDEAHKMPDIAREFFGMSASAAGIRRLLRKARPKGDGIGAGIGVGGTEDAEQATNSYFDQLTSFMHSARYRTRLKHEIPVNPYDMCGALDQVRAQARHAKEQIAHLAEYGAGRSQQGKRIAGRVRELEQVDERLYEITKFVKEASDQVNEPDEVYYLDEVGAEKNAMIKSKIVDVAPILAHDLFKCGELREEVEGDEEIDDPRPNHCVLTSATLTTGGTFNFIARELGAPMSRTNTVIGRSPFKEGQSLLIVPSKVPFPNGETAEEYSDLVPSLVADCIEGATGRTLALFTSYRNLRKTHDYLQNTQCPFRLLVQGEAPRTQLVERFKEDESSVLLGTESFWAGVDVPGQSLSCVVIDRIPFPTPDDPVLSMLSDQDQRAFFTQMIPRASIQLKQGVGRLIRAVTDRGVVVILDRRIVDKGYGKEFVRSLPPMLKDRNLESIREFLGRS